MPEDIELNGGDSHGALANQASTNKMLSESHVHVNGAEKKKTDAGKDADAASDEKDKKKKKKKEEPPKVGFFELYRFSTVMERILLLFGAIGGLGHGVIQPMFIRTFGDLIDTLETTPDMSQGPMDPADFFSSLIETFNGFILILVYLAAAAFVGAYLRTAMFIHVGHSQANRIRKEYLTAIMRQEIAWFDTKKTGELTTRLANDIPLIHDAVSEKAGALFYCISLFVSGYVVSFTTSWKVGLVVLGATPALIITIGIVGRFLFVYSSQAQKMYADAGSIAQEILGAVKTVMVFGGQKEEEKRYNEKLEILEKAGVKKSFVESFGTSVPFAVGFCLYALALWYGSTLVLAEELTTGRVLIAFMCVTMASSGLGIMSPCMATINIGRAAAVEIFKIIDRKSEIDSLSPAGLKPEQCKGEISVKDVKFTYPSRPDIQVLKGISIDVGSGQTVALVGKSGSGKSTIIGLLERFYNPNEGIITLDGVPISDLNVKWLRSRIGIVGQEPTLFAGTIAENIAITKEGATMEEIVAAAKEANAHDFISSLPEGYNTIVYQKGGNLSGGQKQRIAIARALIKKPQILLLDEATSALDSKSERVVQDALEKASVGRSTIVIAHRLSTIKNASCIHVFDQGTIIESGTHDQLMAKDGVYANMVHLQSVAATKENGDLTEGKERSTTIDPLKKVASNKLFDVDDDEEEEGVKKKKQRTVNYWYVIKKLYSNHWRHEWHLNTLGIMAGLGQGAVFPLFGWVFAKVLLAMMLEQGDKLREDVDFWCLMLVVVGVGAAIDVYIQNITFLNSGERFTKRLRYDLFSHVIRQRGAWFDFKGHEPAVFEAILAQDAPLMPKASGRLLGQFAKIVSVIGVSIAIGCVYCWELSLVIVACIPLSSMGNYLKVRSIKGFAVQTRKAYGRSGIVAAEAIENVRTVYSLTLEPHFLARFQREILKPERKGKKDAQMNGVGFGYGEACQLLVMALAFWYGGKLIESESCDIEGMFVTIMCVVNMGLVIGDTLHIFPDFQQALDAALTYYEFMVQEKEIVEGQTTGQKPSSCEGNITFEEVRFAYPTRPENEVLKGFSVKVSRGQTLALVGHSGCGKSTTVSILERIYSFDSGNVMLDGVDIKKLDISWLRQQMGYVGQEPVVFARSIRENIVYGIENVTEEQLQTAIKKANAYEFLSRLPDGLNTFTGERGTQLSGGQKQRIAIARALIRDPKILLLDEATSALDSESEKAVQEAINEARKGRTTIVIAHRLSTIKDADIIAVVDKGRVIETGTHNELIEKQGAYYNFVQAQTMVGM